MEGGEFEVTKFKATELAMNARMQCHKSSNENSSASSMDCSAYGNPLTDKYYSSVSLSSISANETSGAAAASLASCSFNIPSAVLGTPPAKRFQRVRNPFEAALTERLHLPLIGSPSLFQRPATPQMSSTKFEWTIDEVSSLKPANVEAHETQFHNSPDPEYEAKAQLAISSYFSEQKIVPSPVNCPLRSQRIILSDLNSNTPISKPGRRIRDCAVQTELSLPFILPAALEEALRPYFQPHLAIADEHLTKYSLNRSDGEGNPNDISLRRKLFDIHNIVVLENDNKTPKAGGSSEKKSTSSRQPKSSPLSVTAIVGKLSDSMDKSSFGSLSPISATSGLSFSPYTPRESTSKRKSRLDRFLNELEVGELSPIRPATRRGLDKSLKESSSKENYRPSVHSMSEQTFDQNLCESPLTSQQFTPNRSSSPRRQDDLQKSEFSTDGSFNIKVSRLMVNSFNGPFDAKSSQLVATPVASLNLMTHNDTEDMLEIDDDDMQVSQLSIHSSNCSSTSDTPRSRRRSVNRKNLSQSFSAQWLETGDYEDEIDLIARLPTPKLEELIQGQSATTVVTRRVDTISPERGVSFYRADSGFNEMTTSSNATSTVALHHYEHSQDVITAKTSATIMQHFAIVTEQEHADVSMVGCCSTPTKRARDSSR